MEGWQRHLRYHRLMVHCPPSRWWICNNHLSHHQICRIEEKEPPSKGNDRHSYLFQHYTWYSNYDDCLEVSPSSDSADFRGAPALNLDKLSDGAIASSVLGVAGVTAALCVIFLLPYFHRRLIKEDWTLRFYHIFWGPTLLFRGPVPPVPENVKVAVVQDFYRGKVTKTDLQNPSIVEQRYDEAIKQAEAGEISGQNETSAAADKLTPREGATSLDKVDPPEPFYRSPRAFWYFLKGTVLRGMFVDVVEEQSRSNGSKLDNLLAKNVEEVHSYAHKYDNKTEYLYSMLQVFTATTASFAHGSNDVSNAMGPLTAIYQVWATGTSAARLPVPVWILAFGGVCIVIGLATYGYNVMRNLGNRLTLQSPSRGFSMELGSALTIVLASRLALPISTTQCIVGATMAVGLCNGHYKSINWRMIGWCYMGWLITLPITAIVSGVLTSIILYAPRWGMIA